MKPHIKFLWGIWFVTSGYKRRDNSTAPLYAAAIDFCHRLNNK